MKNILKHIAEEAAKRGHDVTIRNIAYALMRVRFNDAKIAYTIINSTTPERDSDVDAYDSMDKIQYLIHWFERDLAKSESARGEDIVTKALRQHKEKQRKEDTAISAEENFEGAVEQLKRIKELRERCDPDDIKTLKDLEKAELEIRVKLVDKFDVQKEEMNECIIVPKVYDYDCPWTGRECYQIGKEEAMEKWNLIEKK